MSLSYYFLPQVQSAYCVATVVNYSCEKPPKKLLGTLILDMSRIDCSSPTLMWFANQLQLTEVYDMLTEVYDMLTESFFK